MIKKKFLCHFLGTGSPKKSVTLIVYERIIAKKIISFKIFFIKLKKWIQEQLLGKLFP